MEISFCKPLWLKIITVIDSYYRYILDNLGYKENFHKVGPIA